MTHAIEYMTHATITDAAIRARLGHVNRMHAEELPEDPPFIVEDAIARMHALPSTWIAHFWLVRDGARVVAQARLDWQELDSNRAAAGIDVTVEPHVRRQGLGTRLLSLILDVASAADRRLLFSGTTDKLPSGGRFLERVGFEAKYQAHVNQLTIGKLDRGLMADWCTAGQRRAGDYALELWDGPVPETKLEAFAVLTNVMNTAPRGDLDLEDTKITPQMIREGEACAFANGSRRLITCARHVPTGELAGYTELYWNPKRAAIVGQGATGVLQSHRNQGLGRWLKAANIMAMLDANPEARFVRTGNADSNGPMLAINRRMGFAPFMADIGWQGRAPEIASRLHQHERAQLLAS
jgi:GNAT superfamily N-acetyltransferase